MSFVIATPELVQCAAQDLAGIRSSLAEATASVSAPTTGIAAAAQDEVSDAIASLFGGVGQEFQALTAQAQAFHTQFVNLVNASAGAYVSAEVANAQQTLAGAVSAPAQAVLGGNILGNIGQNITAALTAAVTGAPAAAQLPFAPARAAALDLIGPWQQVLTTTTGNAQSVFAASQQALNSLSGGVSAEFSQLFASPATFVGNLQTAVQSVALVGAPSNVQLAVVQHTLGGVTTVSSGPDDGTFIPNVHVEIYQGLVGTGDFSPPTGPLGALVAGLANFAASPLSGVLIGFVGPVVSPGVQLFDNAQSIVADLTGGNPAAALGEFLNTPADVVNAFFNGSTLNLDPLLPLVNPFVSAGDDGGEYFTSLSIAFGGVFSPGQVVTGASGPMYYGTGGSMLNSLGMDISLIPPDSGAGDTLAVTAIPVGPIAATAGLIDIFGQALSGSLLG